MTTEIKNDNASQTEQATHFIIQPSMINEKKDVNFLIGYTYLDQQTEMQFYLSREIHNKIGKKVKSLCILNALASTWKITINSEFCGFVHPKCTLNDVYLISVDDFGTSEKRYEIKLEKCTAEEIKNQVDETSLEWTRRIWMHIYMSQKYCDAVISCKGGYSIKVHRFALASASPVLRATFAHGSEAETGILYTPDIDKETLDFLVRYIYCGVTNMKPELCERVLVVSDKYDLPLLKTVAEKKICQMTNEENAIKYLELAELYRLEDLKKKCYSIVAKDNFVNAKSYENLKDVNILQNILKQRLPKVDGELGNE